MTASPENIEGRTAVRLVAVLLVATVAVSLIFGALTLLFRQDVLTYQLARDPGADPDALAWTLWIRPIPIVVVAIAYVSVVRRLLAGARRAYRRIRIVSAFGFLAAGWLLVSAAYPPWLRLVEGVQVALLAALIGAVNRPVVRAVFAADTTVDLRPRHWRAALLLVVATPMVAEVSLGSVPLREAWVIPIYVPIYGAGALFIREIVRRTGGGLANLLLMGVVYGLVEEGLALQSLTSTHLYGAATWAPRVFGVNTAYAEANLVYHALFSVTIPIVLVEAVYASHGTRAYLRRGGVIVSGAVALLGAVLLRVTVPPSQDPGYLMSRGAVLVIGTAVVMLTAIGLLVRVSAGRSWRPPSVRVVGCGAGVAVVVFLGLIWPFGGARQPSFTHGWWVLAPMGVAGVLVIVAGVVLRRWSAHRRWTARHLWAGCVGAVVGHTVFGLVGHAHSVVDRVFLGALALLTVALGVILCRMRSAGQAVEHHLPDDAGLVDASGK